MVLVLLLDNRLLPPTAPMKRRLCPLSLFAQVVRKRGHDAVTICRVHGSILSSGSRSAVRPAQASVWEPLATNQQ